MAYRAQKYGVERPPFVNDPIRHQFLRLHIMLTAVGVFDKVVVEPIFHGAQDFEAFAHHFRPDAVAADDSNVVCFHSLLEMMSLCICAVPSYICMIFASRIHFSVGYSRM